MIGVYKAAAGGYSGQITVRQLTGKKKEKKNSNYRAGWRKKNNPPNDKNQARKGGWEEKGINELRQIKPCSYCTLETGCHGGRRGSGGECREAEEGF